MRDFPPLPRPLRKAWIRLATLALLLGLAASCAQPQVKAPEGPRYVTPEITYLLDSPSPAGYVLGPLYRGDEVELVDATKQDWWRVKVRRTGQTGWLRQELLSSQPVATVFYYVNQDNLPLKECPGSDCLPLQMLSRGEPVQRLEKRDDGWWRVLALKNRSVGWVPGAALSESLEEASRKAPPKRYFYVAIAKLNLRAQPSNRGEVIRTLKFNDQVEKLGDTEGWVKVRQPSTGAVGWVMNRDLEALPLRAPRGLGPAKTEPKPFKQREQPLSEPEFM